MSGTLASLILEVDSTQVASGKTRLDALGVSAGSVGEDLEKLTRKQDAFLQSMDRQAATMGRGAAALRAYRAEQLGLTDDRVYQRLNTQISELERNANIAAGGMGNFGDTMERVAMRSAARFLVVGIAVQGTISVIKTLVDAQKDWDAANIKMVDFLAQGGIQAGSLAQNLRKEAESLNAGTLSANDARNAHERMGVIKAELMALGPNYRDALSKENMSLKDILDTTKRINEETSKKIDMQIKTLEAKGPDTHIWTDYIHMLHESQAEAQALFPKWLVGGTTYVNTNLDQLAATSDLKESQKYAEEWKKLNADKAALKKSTAEMNGAYDRKSSFGGDNTTQYGKEIQRLQEQLLSLTESEDAAYRKKLQLMDNGTGGNVGKAMGLYWQIEDYQKSDAANKAFFASSKSDADALNSIMMESVEKYQELGKSLSEITRLRMLDHGATEQQIADTLAWDAAFEAKKADLDGMKKMQEEISRMNERDDFQTHLAHLNGLKNATGDNKLTEDAYSEQLLKLMKSGDSPFAPLITSMDSFGNSAANAMGKWATGMDSAAIHWSSMVRSMMTELATMEAQKGMDSILGLVDGSLASMFGGSGDYSSTASTTNLTTDFSMPASYSGSSSLASPGSSSTPLSSAVSVQINNNGSVSSKATTATGGAQLGRDLEAAVTRHRQASTPWRRSQPGVAHVCNQSQDRT